MADGSIFGIAFTSFERADHDLAGIEPDSRLQWQAPRAAKLIGITAELLLHPQCCIKGSLRMVLMRQGRPEQCKNTVTSRLNNVAVIVADGDDHQLERRI